tara:strand:+ start:970 stop:1713 length:744 start_codon:yes stop_codon:yes gene_type:complete
MIVNESHVRALVREQIKNKLVLDSYARACDEILEARQLNEFKLPDMSDLPDFPSLVSGAASAVSSAGFAPFTDAIKQELLELLFERFASMGFPIDRTSVAGEIIINIFAEFEWSNLSKYFDGKEGCQEIANVFIGGIQSGLQERGMNTLMEVMFGPGVRLEGILGSPGREFINIKLKEITEEMLREPLTNFFCDHSDFDKLISDFKSGLPDMEIGGNNVTGVASKGKDDLSTKFDPNKYLKMVGREK